jgi:hypothetical protein
MEKGCQRQGLQDNGIGFQERCKRVKVGQVYARGVGTLGMEKGCHGVARGGWQDNDIGFQDRCKSVWGGGGGYCNCYQQTCGMKPTLGPGMPQRPSPGCPPKTLICPLYNQANQI